MSKFIEIRGNKLTPAARKEALASFIYRNTIENKGANASAVARAGGSFAPITDEQWLAITDFTVHSKTGNLKAHASCMTHDSEIPERKAAMDKWAADRAALVAQGLNPDARFL